MPRNEPMPKKESFSWIGDVQTVPGVQNLIRGEALHPIKTVHPEEWPGVRVYLEEELQKSARTLAGKPLLLDHSMLINGEVTGAEYEDGAIEYVAKIGDPRILDLIKSGAIKHCSVEFEWKSLEHVNGVAPRGITFTGLSLLKNFDPGDPLSTVEVWEAIVKRLKEGMSTAKEQAEPQEFILYVIRDSAAFLEERFSTVWLDLENGIQAIYGRLRESPENSKPMALLFMKAKGWTLEKMQGWLQDHSQYLRQSQPAAVAPAGKQSVSPTPSIAQGVMKMNKEELEKLVEAKVKAVLKEQQNQEPEKDEHGCIIGKERFDEESQTCVAISSQQAQEAEWDAEYINDLPDDAFAVIASGGEKDEQGKTVPRTLRKLPYKNVQGNIDLPHLRNALARLNQIEPTSLIPAAKKKLCAAARSEKAEDLVSEFCGEEPETAAEQQGNQEPEKDEHGCVIGKERFDEEQDKCVLISTEQQGNEEPEKDEHGCLIGKETWDAENEKCIPISAEARIAFLEAKLRLKEQEGELSVDEIKQKIADLTKQREELDQKLYPESPLSEEEQTAVRAQLEQLFAEIEAYEQALAVKVAGQAVPPEQPPATESKKKKGLGEAIIPTTASQPNDLISRKEVLALLPTRVPRHWGYGPHKVIMNLKRKLKED